MGTVGKVKLSNGQDMPLVAYGTWNLPKEKAGEAIKNAINAGYRAFDFAVIYENEREIGRFLGPYLRDPKNPVKREDLFLTSKLWNTEHKFDRVRAACLDTLHNLQMDYLDLYLIHWPVATEKCKDESKLAFVPLHETWEAMQGLVDEGLVKAIGISNYTIPLVFDCLAYSRIKPVVNQFERHPYLVQPELVKFCKEWKIQPQAYSPLGSPGLNPDAPALLDDQVIKKLAAKYNKTPAQISLRWQVQQECPVVVKSVDPERMASNLKIFDFQLSEEDMNALAARNKKFRYVVPEELPIVRLPVFS